MKFKRPINLFIFFWGGGGGGGGGTDGWISQKQYAPSAFSKLEV